MKRTVFLAVLTLMLCLLAPLAAVGIVQAQASGGTHVDYETSNAPTIDGKWTSGTEWTDGKRENIGSSAIFYDMWTYGTTVNENIIIETLDNTNDAGDYVQICFDGANNLGSSPQTDDFLVNVTGHSTCTWYEGTGSTWSAIATPDSSIFSFAQTLGTSPVYGTTQHYMTEFSFNKQGVVNGQSFLAIQFNMRIAVYDAHSGGLGAAAFPASSTANNPSGWEYIDYSSNTNSPTDPLPIPESLSVGVIMVLSVVAVVAGAMILSKRSKIAELAGKQKSVIA